MESPKEIRVESADDKVAQNILHDSMVTVRLSEPPALHIDTIDLGSANGTNERNSQDTPGKASPNTLLEEIEEGEEKEESPRITMMDPNGNEVLSPSGSDTADSQAGGSRRGSDSSQESVEGGGVNWEELEKTEEQEPRNESSDDSTALLLARLEQENNLLATNPKSGIVKVQVVEKPRPRQSRPPSIQHLKRLVNGPTPSALRYSMIQAPPMTDLEFYAALVQDYTRTAQCLPILLSKKIRSGIPPPLRGVVWQSMSGARDALLEDQFDRLCGESSPYEGIISKDLGRSFPGVEMFRDPEGDGQRMLGRVLKCFSLYDHKIGYCQGLGFLVGPLLMHMGDKQAFCVLVRLMERYDLRSCFLPDLSGLHVRIYQFRQLLTIHLPELSAHLDTIGVEPAYVSQWFLSFFAVTCPLPMLFRIYDVIFAEGASETIMRVALSLMRKNADKLMAYSEIEDVMQLLLSRGLWDVYHYNADEFVNDFTNMTGVVTRESLQQLEQAYKEAQVADAVTPSENVGNAASRFLGRLWAGSNSSTKSVNLSPGLTAPSRPISFLRRSPSKQSMSTLNSMDGAASDSMLSTYTDATSVSRDSSNADGMSIRNSSMSYNNHAPKMNKDKNLHSQIEDLLTALSELQRDHAVLATQLQKEKEDREEDRMAVRSLLDGLRKKASADTISRLEGEAIPEAKISDNKLPEDDGREIDEENEDEKTVTEERSDVHSMDLSHLLDIVEERFQPAGDKRTSMIQSKSQLRDEVVRAKEQLHNEMSKTQDLNRQLAEHHQEIQNLKDQVREGHTHIRNAHGEKQRLERAVQELKMKKGVAITPDGSRDNDSEWPQRTSAPGGGLRELRLGRTNSDRSQHQPPAFNKRTSSLSTTKEWEQQHSSPTSSPANGSTSPQKGQEVDIDALVLELVQAKTKEAVARQDADELRGQLEALRKAVASVGGMAREGMGMGPRSSSTGSQLGGVVGKGSMPTKVELPSTPSPAVGGGGGFWGGWGKRTVSSSGE